MRSIRDHLIDRHMDLGLHKAWISESERLAVFPLWNLSGQMVGYQQYRPDAGKEKRNHPKDGRYFTYNPKNVATAVWGLESWYLSDELYICEGIFDACRMTAIGSSAIATMSNNPKHLRSWFSALSRPIVAICDPDNAGRQLAKYGDVAYIMPEGSDLGDADEMTPYQIKKTVYDSFEM